MLFEEIGLDKIKLIKTYSANSISKLTNGQIREIIEEQIDSPANTSQDISSEKIPQSVSNHVTEISETAGPEKNLPEINAPKPAEVSISTAPIPSTHVSNSSNDSSRNGSKNTPKANDDLYYETNEVKGSLRNQADDNSDCSHDNDSEEEMSDDSDDDRYNRYGRYNEYDECNRGYYYCNGRYERRGFSIMSLIIFLITI